MCANRTHLIQTHMPTAQPVHYRQFQQIAATSDLMWFILVDPDRVVAIEVPGKCREAKTIQTAFRAHLARSRAKAVKAKLCLATALHPKIGEGCGVACLGEDLLKAIAEKI